MFRNMLPSPICMPRLSPVIKPLHSPMPQRAPPRPTLSSTSAHHRWGWPRIGNRSATPALGMLWRHGVGGCQGRVHRRRKGRASPRRRDARRRDVTLGVLVCGRCGAIAWRRLGDHVAQASPMQPPFFRLRSSKLDRSLQLAHDMFDVHSWI